MPVWGWDDAGSLKLLLLAYGGLFSGFLLLKFLKEDAGALPELSVFKDTVSLLVFGREQRLGSSAPLVGDISI